MPGRSTQVREVIRARLVPAGAPPVPPWTSRGELVRAGFAVLVGLLPLVALAVRPGATVAEVLLHAAVLAAAVALLRLRRSRPVLVTLVLVIAAAQFSVVLGAMLIALVSLATGRRWWRIAGVGAVLVAGPVVADLVSGTSVNLWAEGGLVLAVLGTCVGFGAFIGSRRELEDALRERARSAEREQAARVRQAQVAERTRIAREMHDVLAHRISLVAMHAGVLAYRPDLPAADRTATAEVVRDNANRALAELRQVLGVLRADEDADPAPAPQPTLEGLDDLLAEAVRAGSPVRLELDPATRAALPGLPASLSRNAYRIAQEGLTNARKHAPGAPVRVRITGAPGGLLTLTVRNPAGSRPTGTIEGSGTGLIGVSERVRLLDGHLDHGPDGAGGYQLTAVLPWPETTITDEETP